MIDELSRLLNPLTAAPWRENYLEQKPCAALRPYVHCFWQGADSKITLVVPDLCMDILFEREADGSIRANFCGICDAPFLSHGDNAVLFAVRFYAWSVPFFSKEPMSGAKNAYGPAEEWFGGLAAELAAMLEQIPDFPGRAAGAEEILFRHLRPEREKAVLLNGLWALLQERGASPVLRAAEYACVGPRQMERLFSEYVGVGPKRFAEMARYQYLLRDLLLGGCFDVQEAVLRYGYVDQPHLLRDFRRFHSMTPSEARLLALRYRRANNVAFLQDGGEQSVIS